MAPPLSPESPRNGLRPDHASGAGQVLTESAPASYEAAARLLVQPAPASRDLVYTTALVAACQRMWAAPDVAVLWRTIVDEAVALVPADGVAVVTYTERFCQVLAARPGGGAPGDSAAAAAAERLVRLGLLRQPVSIDDLGAGASWDGLGWRALLVRAIEGSPRQPVRLVWYATRPASLAQYSDLATAFVHLASLASGAVTERDNLNRAMAARHRVGLAQGILMIRRQITAEEAFIVLRRQSQITNVKLRGIAQTVIQTGDLPVDGESKAR